MEKAIRRFLRFLEVDCQSSRNTVLAYQTDLSQVKRFLESRTDGQATVSHMMPDNLKEYSRWMEARNYAPATIARKLASLRSFIDFLSQEGLIENRGILDLLQPPERHRLSPRTLSAAESEAIFEVVKEPQSPRAWRDWAIIALLNATGMRASEIVDLRVADFDFDRGTVMRPPARDEPIPLGTSSEAVRNYLGQGRPNLLRDSQEQACFLNQRGEALTRQGLWLVVKKWVEQAGISGEVSPQTFRHTAARQWLESGKSQKEVQALLGLSSPNTLRVHFHSNGSREE